jgi:hypothetical protein
MPSALNGVSVRDWQPAYGQLSDNSMCDKLDKAKKQAAPTDRDNQITPAKVGGVKLGDVVPPKQSIVTKTGATAGKMDSAGIGGNGNNLAVVKKSVITDKKVGKKFDIST